VDAEEMTTQPWAVTAVPLIGYWATLPQPWAPEAFWEEVKNLYGDESSTEEDTQTSTDEDTEMPEGAPAPAEPESRASVELKQGIAGNKTWSQVVAGLAWLDPDPAVCYLEVLKVTAHWSRVTDNLTDVIEWAEKADELWTALHDAPTTWATLVEFHSHTSSGHKRPQTAEAEGAPAAKQPRPAETAADPMVETVTDMLQRAWLHSSQTGPGEQINDALAQAHVPPDLPAANVTRAQWQLILGPFALKAYFLDQLASRGARMKGVVDRFKESFQHQSPFKHEIHQVNYQGIVGTQVKVDSLFEWAKAIHDDRITIILVDGDIGTINANSALHLSKAVILTNGATVRIEDVSDLWKGRLSASIVAGDGGEILGLTRGQIFVFPGGAAREVRSGMIYLYPNGTLVLDDSVNIADISYQRGGLGMYLKVDKVSIFPSQWPVKFIHKGREYSYKQPPNR
jgi:hypothetical protein